MAYQIHPRSVPQSASDLLREELAEHEQAFQALRAMIEAPFLAGLELLEDCLRGGGKLLLFGNGGSAADAQHIAAELVVRYKTDRAAIAAIALTTDTSALTACGNDLGFEAIFARQIEALAVRATLRSASRPRHQRERDRGRWKPRGMRIAAVGLGGGDGGGAGPVRRAARSCRSKVTARIQEMHITSATCSCKALEQRLG